MSEKEIEEITSKILKAAKNYADVMINSLPRLQKTNSNILATYYKTNPVIKSNIDEFEKIYNEINEKI